MNNPPKRTAMKNPITLRLGLAAAAALALASCQDTWLMYDTSQKDRLYFEVTSTRPQISFALTDEQELPYNLSVKMMGMPVDRDRTFTVEYVDVDPDETIDAVQVVGARPGTDFEIAPLVLPAGACEVSIPLTLYRQETLQNRYVCIRMRIVEDEAFLPLAADSANLKKIRTPLFELYVSDGEPACPDWWDTSTSNYQLFGWSMYLGSFHAEKFRRMLDLYHQIEEKNPIFYQECVDKYGENLDKEGIAKSFFASENSTVWALYVLIPLCEYYKVYYAEHPDDPRFEIITTSSLTSGQYWKDPIGLLR